MAKSNSTTSKVNFTADRVRSFKCANDKKESFIWDKGCTGLGIRAFGSGRKTYIFQKWINGKSRRAVIGPVDSFDIEQARAKAKELQVKASDYISPAKVKENKQLKKQPKNKN
ncbi:Arm DNA-binding domain-containing protein [Paraglaciecola aquimarina]|uniref:Arm DNA-binding domain-containing protein n=1 Tax=Paraglaciecola aquimarina TaxID=1235557 RepID=A0ABU3SWU1_9ALTE|nr:Arm DNA-binding domain-containing protein [Paraglaciecola aquimarina]MDU0354487.1 Arm DNA-binding domain-containing protein [Paraglaciecola aquimarina]